VSGRLRGGDRCRDENTWPNRWPERDPRPRWRLQASLRGVGCDCLGLARGVWREVVGREPFPIPPYSRDWGETCPREVQADGARAMMPEIAAADAPPGALILFRMMPRAIAKHVGILTSPVTFLQQDQAARAEVQIRSLGFAPEHQPELRGAAFEPEPDRGEDRHQLLDQRHGMFAARRHLFGRAAETDLAEAGQQGKADGIAGGDPSEAS